MAGFDTSALSKAIEETRKKSEEKSKGLGEYNPEVDNGLPKGDKSTRAYARKIAEGLETHRPNAITNKIKQIDTVASNFKADPNGGVSRVANQQPQYQPPQSQYQQPKQQLGEELDREIPVFNNMSQQIQPQNNLTSRYGQPSQPYPQFDQRGYPIPNNPPQPQMMQNNNLNENRVIEFTNNVAMGYLNENFERMVQQQYFNTIMETYNVERFKKVLDENEHLLESVLAKILTEKPNILIKAIKTIQNKQSVK